MAVISYQGISASLAEPFIEFVLPSSAFNIWCISSAIMIAVGAFWLANRKERPGFRKIIEYLFPKEIIFHPSAIFEFQWYFVGRIFMTIIFGITYFPITIGVSHMVTGGLTFLFGPSSIVLPPYLSKGLETVCYVFAFDLGYWCLHWMLHKTPWLWELHKSHHSAEVITPLSALRSHPIDEFLQVMFSASFAVSVVGIFSYINGHETSDFQLFGTNVLLMVYFLTIFNLRHSHIWLPIRGPLAYIIQSPAHHQLHHSAETRHFDKNLGFCLSFWDWIFGTLYIPPLVRDFKMGIGAESNEYYTLTSFLTLPFIKIARRIKSRYKPAVQSPSVD